jgi:hypothetical protein
MRIIVPCTEVQKLKTEHLRRNNILRTLSIEEILERAKLIEDTTLVAEEVEDEYVLEQTSQDGWQVSNGHKSVLLSSGPWEGPFLSEQHDAVYIYDSNEDDKLWLCDLFSDDDESQDAHV